MKKLLLLVFALALFASCTPESNQDNGEQQSCPAPDTNCNGIPDHEEGLSNSGG